ncbi:hypothetical protein M3Y97_00976900 [Aphelenchoides bicaudatus]|nr:hypothetical protein M3Y97_00976900 [Aphelenchoides bicaudatus]
MFNSTSEDFSHAHRDISSSRLPPSLAQPQPPTHLRSPMANERENASLSTKLYPSSIPQSRNVANANLNSVRQPLYPINLNQRPNRHSNDDVFFPPSSSRVPAPKTPDFRHPDGRSSHQLAHDIRQIHYRIQENHRRSRENSRQPSRQLYSREENYIPTSRNEHYYPVRQPSPSRSPVRNDVVAWSHRTDPLIAHALRSSSLDRYKARPAEHQRPQTRQVNRAPIKVRSPVQAPILIDKVVEKQQASRHAAKTVNFTNRIGTSDLDNKKQDLLNELHYKHPELETLLKPVIEKAANELPAKIMIALKDRHRILLASLRRIDKSTHLASADRRKCLNDESNEHKLEDLKCLSLMLEIEARFFVNGTDKPSVVPVINDQLRFLREIFSVDWRIYIATNNV